jgi:outer membrane protein OmpA-like peptidoglycan-associated protein
MGRASCPMLWTVLSTLVLAQGEHSAAPRIPLCVGLTVVSAIEDPKGDYEAVVRVASITQTSIELDINADRPINSVIRRLVGKRTVLREDFERASFIMNYWSTAGPRTIPGSTALGPSRAVLRALKTKGTADISLLDPIAASMTPEQMRDYLWPFKLQRVAATVLPVTVNGALVELPAIHARGSYMGDRLDAFYLDDESNPLGLKSRVSSGPHDPGRENRLARVSFDCNPASGVASAPSRIERALLAGGRADVYDIFFDFNSDRIRELSDPTLAEIAGVLKRHPDWKLGIEGHTDSIASDAYNQTLSERRAVAVKAALAERYGVNPTRLSTAGFGESRPKERNDTLEGRARNRRVELVRQP